MNPSDQYQNPLMALAYKMYGQSLDRIQANRDQLRRHLQQLAEPQLPDFQQPPDVPGASYHVFDDLGVGHDDGSDQNALMRLLRRRSASAGIFG